MKLEFVPIRKKIDLGEYAEEMSGGIIRVHVNVDQETVARMRAINGMPEEDFFKLLADLWSCPPAGAPLSPSGVTGSPEAAEWPVEDVRALFRHCMEQDPQLWNWVTGRTWQLIWDYRGYKRIDGAAIAGE